MKNYYNNYQDINKRYPSLDFLKGVCILWVIITHASWTGEQRLALAFPFWIEMTIPIFMLISGYVYALSYKRKNISSLDQAFSVKVWLKPFIRYTLPFLMIFLIEAVANLISGFVKGNGLWWHQYLSAFLTGGWGPGSYYVPMLMQLIFVFPFIYILIKKFKAKGLLTCFLINLFYEFLKFPFSISSGLYRLLVFRHFFLIAFGCYAALYGLKNKKVNTISIMGAMLAVVFIIVTQYSSYTPIIFTEWTSRSLPAILFIIPFFSAFVSEVKSIPKFLMPINFIGKASYNIFFTQMLYYSSLSGVISGAIGNQWWTLLVNVLICVVSGILFYLIETPITKYISKKVYSKFK